MIQPRKYGVVLVALVATAGVVGLLGRAQTQNAPPAQTQNQLPPMNHTLVVLDPAHGGSDSGAKLGDGLLEKDVTLALAVRLRSELMAAGFSVILTRDNDTSAGLTTDQRAEVANRVHPVACLVIHATGSGTGVHLYASALPPKDPLEDWVDADADYRAPFEPTPWETAQAESIGQSLHLQNDLSAALGTANLPVVAGRATIQPLDSMMCPAVAVELAPLTGGSGDATPVTDTVYQQRVTGALTRSLQFWRGHADPAARPAPTMTGTTP